MYTVFRTLNFILSTQRVQKNLLALLLQMVLTVCPVFRQMENPCLGRVTEELQNSLRFTLLDGITKRRWVYSLLPVMSLGSINRRTCESRSPSTALLRKLILRTLGFMSNTLLLKNWRVVSRDHKELDWPPSTWPIFLLLTVSSLREAIDLGFKHSHLQRK